MASKVMEAVHDVAPDATFAAQPREQFGLRLLDGGEEARSGGDLLGEHLPELAQLHEGGDRVGGEVLLGTLSDQDQLRVVPREEPEVRRG